MAKPAAHDLAENILRVDAERIDNVLNLVGELIIGKSMLQQALNEFAKCYPKDACAGKFADAMAFQARVLNDLQRSVMKIRMVPVEQLFRRFPRMVRDVARQCGKDVELVVSGEDTDLDKSILDAIAEPLTIWCVTPSAMGSRVGGRRQKRASLPQGTIRLNAYHQGNQVIVEVSDDGRGIDVREFAQRPGTGPDHGGRSRTPQRSRDLSNLSSGPDSARREEVTEVSGRGVAWTLCRAFLHRLKGTVDIETRPGQGTTFRLKLPLTLAIIKALCSGWSSGSMRFR